MKENTAPYQWAGQDLRSGWTFMKPGEEAGDMKAEPDSEQERRSVSR